MERDHPILGEIILFSGPYAPVDWMFCEGQALPIHNNGALYSAITLDFITPSPTTFTLPDLRELDPPKGPNGIGPRYIIRVSNAYFPQKKEEKGRKNL